MTNAPKATDVLNSIEVNALVEFFFFYATQEQRGKLMAHLPVAYSKLCGGHPSIQEACVDHVRRAFDANDRCAHLLGTCEECGGES